MDCTLREYKSPRKQSFRYVTFPFADMIQRASVKCKQSPVYGVFWPLLPHPSTTDRKETRTGSSLSPWDPSHKILYKSVHNLFSYRGHRQTHRHKPTPVKTYSLAFAEIKIREDYERTVCLFTCDWYYRIRGLIYAEEFSYFFNLLLTALVVRIVWSVRRVHVCVCVCLYDTFERNDL